MRYLRKILVPVVIIFLAVFIIVPPFLGVWIKRSHTNLISFYNTGKNVSIHVIDYQRGWFSSDATLAVLVNYPAIGFMVKQHIQHGPLVHHGLGLVSIHNAVELSGDTARIIKPMNPAASIAEWDERLSLTGRYSNHFQSPGFRMVFMDGESPLQFSPFTVSENLRQSQSGLWVGHRQFSLSQMITQDAKGKMLALTGFNFKSVEDEVAHHLNGVKQISIESMTVNDVGLGPLQVKVSAHHLNADGLLLLRHIHNGDFVEQLMSIFPRTIDPDSRIELNDFTLQTPNGILFISGDLVWPTVDVSAPRLHGLFRASLPLTQELLHLAAELSLLKHPPQNAEHTLLDKQNEMANVAHENSLLIAILIQDKQLPKDAGKMLLHLQEKKVPSEVYLAALQHLRDAHQISPEVTQLLNAKYEQTGLIDLSLEQKASLIEKQFQAQLDGWLQAGLITRDKNNYEARISYESGLVKINGHELVLSPS